MRSCSEHAGIRKRFFFLNNAVNETDRRKLSTNNDKTKNEKRKKEDQLNISYRNSKRKKNEKLSFSLVDKFLIRNKSFMKLNDNIFIFFRPYLILTQFDSLKNKIDIYYNINSLIYIA